MWTLSAHLLLLLLLINPATLISLPDLNLSNKKKEMNNLQAACPPQPDVHHHHRHKKQNADKKSHLQDVHHCFEGKHNVELELVMDERSRSKLRILKEKKLQQALKSQSGKISGDTLKKWYKRMGLY